MNNAIKKPTKRILDNIEQYGYKWDYDTCKYSYSGFKLQGKIQNYIIQLYKNYDHITYYRFYIYNTDRLKNSEISSFLLFECTNLNELEKYSKEYLEIFKKLDFKYIRQTEPFSYKYIKYRFLYTENEIHLLKKIKTVKRYQYMEKSNNKEELISLIKREELINRLDTQEK